MLLSKRLVACALAGQRRCLTDEMAGVWMSHLKPKNLRGRRDADVHAAAHAAEVVEKELGLLREEGWALGDHAYASAISAVAKYGNVEVAQRLFDAMKSEGKQPGRKVYNSLLFAYNNGRGASSAERAGAFMSIYQEMERVCAAEPPDSATVTAVLQGLSKTGSYEAVREAVSLYEAQGAPFSQHAFNIIVAACRDLPEARAVVEKMGAAGFSCDEITYGSMLKACAASCDAAGAVEVWAEMCGRLKPSVREWTGYLTVFKAVGDYDGAMRAWDEMAKAGVAPNSVSYGAAIRVHLDEIMAAERNGGSGGGGRGSGFYAGRASELFREAVAAGAATSPLLVTLMMEVHAWTRNGEGAKEVLGAARGLALPITGYCKKHYVRATGERYPD